MLVQLLARERALRDEDLAELSSVALLRGRSPPAAAGVIEPAPHQDVAEPVAPVHDRGVGDAALVEVDVAEVLAVGDREAAGRPAQGEQLDDVGEAGLLEAALDRHQRQSSITRSVTSGQSHTIFSRLGAPPRGGCDDAARAGAPCRPAPRAAPAPRWAHRRAPPARARAGGRCCASAAFRTRWTWARTTRTESAGRAAKNSASAASGSATFEPSSRRHRFAHLAVGRGELHDESRLEAGAEPRLEPLELGERHGGGEDHLPPRLEQQVVEQEQLVLGAIGVGDQVHVVEEERETRR